MAKNLTAGQPGAFPVVSETRTVAATSNKRRGGGRPGGTPASYKPGQSGNPLGRPPLTEAQRLARSMRAQAQPELVEVLLAIAKDAGADMKDRIAAARALLEEVPAVDADGAAAALTVVIRRQGGDGG